MKSHTTILAIIFGFLFINVFINSETIIIILTIFSGLCLFSKRVSILIEKIWFLISKVLSYIIPNFILFIIFYGILTPFSILSKVFKSKTDFRFKNPSETNFIKTEKVFGKDSFERSW
tara:strand:+ start:131 stop:484 length:354 start_codon:yes stop_codon:yes gene_type:complete